MTPNIILWIYIGLLVLGGLVGFLKAGSKMSLIMSVAFAIPLALCAQGTISEPRVADVLLGFLLIFFGIRFIKSKKFMPNGLMAILSAAALV
ncbi:MAG: TMEM14 family protein, partial [Limisphaerales bacterium]